ENSPDRTFNIWLERRKFVAKQLNTFTSDPRYTEKVNGVDTPNVSALFSAMYEPVDDDRGTKLAAWSTTTPASAFDALLKDLTGGKTESTAAVVEAAKFRIRSDLNLTPDMFVQLMELRVKAAGAKLSPPLNDLLTGDETRELLSILVQAQKTIF